MRYADLNALLCELGQDVIIKDPVTGHERADTVIRTADLWKVPSPWISAFVRLPDKGERVLFAAPDWKVMLGTRSSICELLVECDEVYWMPLPDLPVEVSDVVKDKKEVDNG